MQQKHDSDVRLIDGKNANPENAVGYCYCDAHKGYLTKNLISKHQCLGKKCPFLKKLRPEYWDAREKEEEYKKLSAAEKQQRAKAKMDRLEAIRAKINNIDNTYATNVKETKNEITIYYMYSDKRLNKQPIVKELQVAHGKPITLKAIHSTAQAIGQLKENNAKAQKQGS